VKKHPPARQVVLFEDQVRDTERTFVRGGVRGGPIEKSAPPPNPPPPSTKKLSPAERAIRELVRKKLTQPRIVDASPHRARIVPRTQLVMEEITTPAGSKEKVYKKKLFEPSGELVKAYAGVICEAAKQPPGPPKTLSEEERREQARRRKADFDARVKEARHAFHDAITREKQNLPRAITSDLARRQAAYPEIEDRLVDRWCSSEDAAQQKVGQQKKRLDSTAT